MGLKAWASGELSRSSLRTFFLRPNPSMILPYSYPETNYSKLTVRVLHRPEYLPELNFVITENDLNGSSVVALFINYSSFLVYLSGLSIIKAIDRYKKLSGNNPIHNQFLAVHLMARWCCIHPGDNDCYYLPRKQERPKRNKKKAHLEPFS